MNIKKCPRCGVEYFAHVSACADCGTALVDAASADTDARMKIGPLPEDGIVLKQGDRDWIRELHEVLHEADLACWILPAPGCGGRPSDRFLLVVRPEDGQEASRRVEAYYREMHPEMLEADERAMEGKCPACGHPAPETAVECPDCGLVLLVEENPLPIEDHREPDRS